MLVVRQMVSCCLRSCLVDFLVLLASALPLVGAGAVDLLDY